MMDDDSNQWKMARKWVKVKFNQSLIIKVDEGNWDGFEGTRESGARWIVIKEIF